MRPAPVRRLCSRRNPSFYVKVLRNFNLLCGFTLRLNPGWQIVPSFGILDF